MPVSSARLLANRRNALLSSGPRTVEGKARSRRNSLKHGLTGDGVVLAEAVQEEVDLRFETLQEELQPSGEAGRILLRRFAYLSVRLEKSEEFDTRATAQRVRNAVQVYNDQRMTDVEALASSIATDPMTVARRLQETPEGIDWLISHWGELRDDLRITERKAWTLNHWTRFEELLGRPGGNIRITRPYALTQALSGYFVHLDTIDGAGLDEPQRIEWARDELTRMIDAEIARLTQRKAALNPETLEQDRAEAPARAWFDPSPESNLARKYEAATERAMYKALDRFHDVELAALEGEPVAASSLPAEPLEVVGSFFPGANPPEDQPEEPAGTAPRSVYLPEPAPPHRIAAKPSAKKRSRNEAKDESGRSIRNEPRLSV